MLQVPMELQQVCFSSLFNTRLLELLPPNLEPGDYSTVTQTLTFQPGQTSAQFPVQTKTDNLDELQEDFSLSLSSPTNGAVLGDDRVATVAINDIDCKLFST